MLHDRLKGNLDLLLLAVLEDGPAHGYAVITALRDRSDGGFDLAEGTVYPALHRLEGTGLLGSRWATIGGRRRRVYEITQQGAAALATERARWQRFARSVHAVVGSLA
jgi:PadR family transcriptional regulator, regulatory protein PadR